MTTNTNVKSNLYYLYAKRYLLEFIVFPFGHDSHLTQIIIVVN